MRLDVFSGIPVLEAGPIRGCPEIFRAGRAAGRAARSAKSDDICEARARAPQGWYSGFMSPLHGRGQGGRIVVQDFVDLPEGAEVRLELVEQADDDDQIDPEDRARLEAAIGIGRQEIADGKGIPAEQVVSELWAAHRR